MKRLFPLVAGAALVVATWAGPASAHNYDNTSAYLCGAHRTFSYDELWHSNPIYLDAHVLIEQCKANNPNTGTYTFDVWYSLDDHSSVGTNYQDCNNPGPCENVP